MTKPNLVEIMIYSKTMKSKDGTKTWKKYSTKSTFLVKNEDGTYSKVPHYIDVKFTEDAFNGSTVKLSDIKRGILTVDGKCVGCSTFYEIEERKDGTKKYPLCFIRGGIKSFKPIEKQHTFGFIVNDEIDEQEVEEEND